MSGATSSFISARVLLPDDMVRGQVNVLRCPLYSAGALVAPSSGTVSVYDASGTAQVSGASVTISSSVATYSWTPSTSLTLGDGWTVEWSLIVSGVTRVYRNSGALCRVSLHPVVTDADLFRVNPGLDPAGTQPLTDQASYQDQLDEAWASIYGRLRALGQRPYLIADPWALREPHLLLTLSLVYEGVSTRIEGERWAELGESYRARYEDAWSRLAFRYDTEDGSAGLSSRRQAAQPSTWLCSRGGVL